jgi:DNA-binding NtrC family response regulator
MELQILVVTADQTLHAILRKLATDLEGHMGILKEPVHVLSAPLDRLHLLILDEAKVPNYLSMIKRVRKRFPEMEAMVLGGPKAEEILARERREAVDYYYARPISETAFEAAFHHRVAIAKLKALTGIVGRSIYMEEILEVILQFAPTEVPILIEGESGTGKDIVARTIHLASRRKEAPFEAINCASFAEGVLESELFGHEKGAFTGVIARRAGVFERANRGTIFLDEVREMSPNMQVRLLRVLESGEVLRVGGLKSFHVDIRIIAATNRDLGHAVREGTFRQDLYYRLKGVNIHLPPLKDRPADIPILADYFIIQANRKHNKSIQGIQEEALKKLMSYSWPGNIRELRNLIDTLVVLSSTQKITADLVAAQLKEPGPAAQSLLPIALNRPKDEAERELIYASILALHRDVREIIRILSEPDRERLWKGMREVRLGASKETAGFHSLAQMEREAIQEALRRSGGNRRKAAESLGISERTLYRKIKEYGLV